MTDRRSDQGFSVAPRQLGSGRTRRHPLRRLAVPLVVAIAGGLIAVGWLGPRLAERPHVDVAYFATPTPLATPTPTPTPRPTVNSLTSGATPLPDVTRTDGGRLSQQVAIFGDGFQIANLATGELSRRVGINSGSDAVFRSPSGPGWVCVCRADSGDDSGNVRLELQLIGIDPAGSETTWKTLASLGSESKPLVGIPTDLDVAADGRTALLAFTEITRTDWTYSVARLDLATGEMGPIVQLATETPPPLPPGAPSPTPAPEGEPSYPTSRIYVTGLSVRIAPDGRRAMVWGSEQVQTENGDGPHVQRGWRIEVDPSGKLLTEPSDALAQLPMYCPWAAYATPERFISFCPNYTNDGSSEVSPKWTYLALDGEGRVTGHNDLTDVVSFNSDILFDIANGAVWAWDATALTLVRIDLSSLAADRMTYPANVEVATGAATIRGVPPVWLKIGLPIAHGFGGQMAGSPDGTRLYLLGFSQEQASDTGQPASLGVFVVDTTTESLVQRWHPAALYVSVQPALDGSVVVAGGAPGTDATGREAPWEASLTFHDATDGRILLRLGRIGQNYGSSVMEP